MKKLWFKNKRYGWGWTPATWQGWLVLAIYIVIITKMAILFSNRYAAPSSRDALLGFIVPMFGVTAILLYICYRRGEKPRWRWGGRDDHA